MVSPKDKLKPFLEHFGLTEYEVRVYSELILSMEATAKQLSLVTRVPLGKTYETLDGLRRRGFVVEVEGERPKKYRPQNPKAAFEEPLKFKEEEISQIKETVKDLSAQYQTRSLVLEERPLLLGDKDTTLRFLARQIQNKVEKSYWAFVAFKTPNTPVMEVLRAKPELDVRIVGFIPPGQDWIAKQYVDLGAKVRVLKDSGITPMRFGMFDDTHSALTEEDSLGRWSTYWSPNKGLIRAHAELFQSYWAKGRRFRSSPQTTQPR